MSEHVRRSRPGRGLFIREIRCMLRIVSLAVFLLIGSLHAVSLHAEELFLSSFSIIPPPPANTFFKPEEKGLKLRVGYFSMQGTGSTNPFELNGYGLDATNRRSFSDRLALDFNFGAVYLAADHGSMGLNGIAVPVSFNLEAQLFKTDVVSMLLFAGPGLNLSYASMEHPTITPGPNIVNDRWDVTFPCVRRTGRGPGWFYSRFDPHRHRWNGSEAEGKPENINRLLRHNFGYSFLQNQAVRPWLDVCTIRSDNQLRFSEGSSYRRQRL